MDEVLKCQVLKALEAKLGRPVLVKDKEWADTVKDTLNLMYTDKLCIFGSVTAKEFIDKMVEVLAIAKRGSAA